MTALTYKGMQYESGAGESVLDTLLRNKIDIPYSCKAGACNICMMVGDEKELISHATHGIKNTLVEQGHFLACQCVVTDPITVHEAEDVSVFCQAIVNDKDFLSDKVCRLRLHPAIGLYYRAGQYINIRMPNGQIRSYSLASLPTEDDYLELHIKRMDGGLMSNWLLDEVQQGDTLEIQGAYGDCYYLSEDQDCDIVMIGTGTGLAPLVGILRDAITSGHKGQIKLYHGEREASGLYFDTELKALSAAHSNIHYFPCASEDADNSEQAIHSGRAADYAFASNKNLAGNLVYLCGSPQMVKSARKMAYLAGASMKQIYSDPFVTKDIRQTSDQKSPIDKSVERRHN